MTSNLGAEALVADVHDDGGVSPRAKQSVMDALHHAFAPEFLNRVDEMVGFIFFFRFFWILTSKASEYELIFVYFMY